ncbi:MAG: hypothetical protein HY040_21055 [Planctomycetes bacterium]|nr:hypothetical protein [Planctomycetota bacterium]
MSLLLSRRKNGGELAGLAVQAGKTVVVTEEDHCLWAERARLHDFGGNVCFIPRPFRNIPTPEQWQALLDRILQLREQHGIDLAVFDPLAPLLRCENNARSIFEALLPLRTLTGRGMANVLLHHPGKGDARPGESARGSGALLGHVDIAIEMRHPGGDPMTRRRRFLALSRHAATPRHLLMELNAEGTEYLSVVDSRDDGFQGNWEVLRMVLEDAPQKLTRFDILEEWPDDFDKPHPATLSEWLNRAAKADMIAREGTGRKNDPFRFWLPQVEEIWKKSPFYDIFEKQRKELKLPFTPLHARGKKGHELPEVDVENEVAEI